MSVKDYGDAISSLKWRILQKDMLALATTVMIDVWVARLFPEVINHLAQWFIFCALTNGIGIHLVRWFLRTKRDEKILTRVRQLQFWEYIKEDRRIQNGRRLGS